MTYTCVRAIICSLCPQELPKPNTALSLVDKTHVITSIKHKLVVRSESYMTPCTHITLTPVQIIAPRRGAHPYSSGVSGVSGSCRSGELSSVWVVAMMVPFSLRYCRA
ncbi:hypothetical protein GDO81_024388 [Engystomops pustulosus]|uniref:Uncharacterized protein n=1 Tax=Engystomops pustulosus TaxID=76066 RepID=A0AAV6Z3I1_ENGPU|nr:hypothetical protein GDO81_024388 [Engystomops pustulosus]